MSKRKTFKDVVFHQTWNNSALAEIQDLWKTRPEKDAPNNEYEGHLHVLQNTILEMSNYLEFSIITYAYSKTDYELAICICEATIEFCIFESQNCKYWQDEGLIKCLGSMRRKFVLGKSRESRENKRMQK
jgi:hypothetical protein